MTNRTNNQNNQNNGKKTDNRLLYKILTGVFLAGLCICIGILAFRAASQKRAEEKYHDLAAMATETEREAVLETEEEDVLEELGITVPEKNLDWDALKEENEDIYAWIFIPNTQIDYPVLQHPTEDDYYLDHNLDDSTGYPGCIYSQTMNAKDFSDNNTVLYGHNMKNGSMFAGLHEFEDNEFFEENPYIYIYTPDKTYVYEIYAACAAGNAHLLYAYDFDTEAGFEQYLSDVAGVRDMNAHVREGIGAVWGRKLLTLSTCIAGKSENRWLVTAVLVNE